MANFVTNRIRLIGNESIKQLAVEINKRFTEDCKKNGYQTDTSSVGRILYGYEGDKAYLSDEMDAKWAHLDGPMDDWEPLRLISGWRALTQIQDHILWYAAKLDPKVIVYMEYEDEMPNFVGARYVLLDDSEIQSFESEIETRNYAVVSEDEVDEYIEKNNETNEYEEVISWQDLSDLLYKQQLIAYKEMCNEYKWAKDDEI
ncbi:hypothetical protein G6677_07915 [Polynucleobacter paneuropaeus]|jgi:hypothetical protein|nr:hypothetical protein [Polynucleobacter paneuropaeus]